MWPKTLSTFLASLMVACGQPSAGTSQTAAGDQASILLVGANLELPQEPTRVLAGNVGTLELAMGLIEFDRVCAIPAEGYQYSVLGDDPESLEGKPQFHTFDAESVLAQEPDLVLASDWQALETVNALGSAGVPVLRVPTPSSWEELEAILTELGEALDSEERATRLCAELRQRRAALVLRGQALGSPLSLVYSNYGAGGATAGKGSTWELILQAAGLRNAATEAGLAGHPTLDIEGLLSLDPDLLLLAEDSAGDNALAELRALPQPNGLRPLESGQIVRLPQTLFATSSQHMLDAAELLIERLEKLR